MKRHRQKPPSSDLNAPKNHSYDNRAPNPFYHIVWGVRFFFMGMRTLIRNSELLSLSLIPMLLTLVLILGLAAGGAFLVGRFFRDTPDIELRIIAQVLMILLTLMIAYFLYLPVARVLLAPFAEALSRRTHAINTGQTVRRNNQGWARAMLEGLKLVIFQLVVALVALALGLAFPPLGAPIGVAVAIFLGGLDFFDVPLSTRGMRLKRKLGLIWRNKSLALGFGGAVYLTLLIPVINMLALPVGVIGATLLTDSLPDE
ncbi:MAG TPA: EI24 domain-containing protein [Blastocatellia bacterium]|nr:EI24 domain-containing protein [Blastocatellia bacterium]